MQLSRGSLSSSRRTSQVAKRRRTSSISVSSSSCITQYTSTRRRTLSRASRYFGAFGCGNRILKLANLRKASTSGSALARSRYRPSSVRFRCQRWNGPSSMAQVQVEVGSYASLQAPCADTNCRRTTSMRLLNAAPPSLLASAP